MDLCEAYVRRVFFGALILILTLSGILMVVGVSISARGVVLGGAASLVNLLLMANSVKRQVTGSTGRGSTVAPAVNYALRMGVMAAALIYAASDPRVSLWTAIPALFVTQAVLVVGDLTGWTEGPD